MSGRCPPRWRTRRRSPTTRASWWSGRGGRPPVSAGIGTGTAAEVVSGGIDYIAEARGHADLVGRRDGRLAGARRRGGRAVGAGPVVLAGRARASPGGDLVRPACPAQVRDG